MAPEGPAGILVFLSFSFPKYLGTAPKRPRLCMAGGGGEEKYT